MAINELAAVDPKAQVADDAEIGPFCSVGPEVAIGAGTVLHANVSIVGRTTLGERNIVHPHATIGSPPQDVSYHDETTAVAIGDDNVIRECVTIHRGTTKERGLTRVGNRCYLMACSHVAHDCVLGDDVIFGNNVLIGGHVHVEPRVIVNGGAAINPFTTIGRLAYVGGLTRIVHDVPPFTIFEGHPSRVRGVNSIGMRRAGLSDEIIGSVAKAYRRIFRNGQPRNEVLDAMENEDGWVDEVGYLLAFLRKTAEGRHGRYRESLRKSPPR